MTTCSKCKKIQWKQRDICCHNISDVIEWFIIIVIISLSIFCEFSSIVYDESTNKNAYIATNNSLYSYPNIESTLNIVKVYTITLFPVYFFFLLNIFLLKITTYYQYEKELCNLRDIEIHKNRNNEANELRLIDSLFNNKYSYVAVLSHFISLTKSILFALGLCHLITFILNTYIISPIPCYYNSNKSNKNMHSFPSKYASDSMSTNCLLFICMIHSFIRLQYKYLQNKENKFKRFLDNDYNYKLFSLSSINNHSFNGNMYFGGNIWYFLRDIKILSCFITIIPLLFSFYIGVIQITQYKHFIIDVVCGYIIGIFCAFLSFCTFKHELLYEINIMSLSQILKTCIQAKNTAVVTSPKAFNSSNKKKKYPHNIVTNGANKTGTFPMIFGKNNSNDFHLHELEEIALQIGSNFARYHHIGMGNKTPILTDDDGIEIDEFEEEEEEEEESDEDTMTETITIGNEDENEDENDIKIRNSVAERKEKLLYQHRKNIKLTLAPPISQQSSRLSPSLDRENNNDIIPFKTNIKSIATTISPLSAPQSVTSYNGYAD